MYITVVPVVCLWLWEALKAGNLAFFTTVNPSLYMSGLYGTPKHQINRLIPAHLLPNTVFVGSEQKDIDWLVQRMNQQGLDYPVIVKPDIGERGLNVFKVHAKEDLQAIIEVVEGDLLVQEFVDLPLEITILCYRAPLSGTGGVTSVCYKEFLSVTGDGVSTIRDLINESPRAILQRQRLAGMMDLDRIPADGERVDLEPIGNHNRGTKFINGESMLDERLEAAMLDILDAMEGVHFGRLDMKANSLEDLREGKNFKVLEFNGVNSEPVHIYDPGHGIWRAYRDWARHWRLIGRIAHEQRQLGIKSRPVSESWAAFRDYLTYRKQATAATA